MKTLSKTYPVAGISLRCETNAIQRLSGDHGYESAVKEIKDLRMHKGRVRQSETDVQKKLRKAKNYKT